MMVFTNAAQKAQFLPKEYAEGFVKLLAPIAPHMMEELWQKLGHNESLTYASWPTYQEQDLFEDNVEIILQVNGKLRNKVKVPLNTSKAELEKIALADTKLQKFINDKKVVKVIAIPNKIVNIVVK